MSACGLAETLWRRIVASRFRKAEGQTNFQRISFFAINSKKKGLPDPSGPRISHRAGRSADASALEIPNRSNIIAALNTTGK
jgi:hypothetical protein